MSACDRSLVSKAFGLGMTQFADRYSPITKRFALRLSGHVQEMANTTRERREKILVSLNWRIVCQSRPYKLI